MKMAESFRTGRKYYEERRNCSLRAISPFPTVISKDFYCRHVKKKGLFGKGLTLLPDDNHKDWTKFKAVADDKFNVARIMISVFDQVENIVGKGENAEYQHFLLFQHFFPKASSGLFKVRIVW